VSGEPRFTLRVLPGPFGAAEIEGLDVDRDAHDPRSAQFLRDALSNRPVLCIRQPAPLDDGAARALVSMFGRVKDPVGRTADGRSLRYGQDRQIIDAGFVMTDEVRAALGDLSFGGDVVRPGLFEHFHTDDSYTEMPASVTVLHARELPTSPGGDTCFLDMRVAFELLDPDEQVRIVGLHAVHAYDNGGAFPPRIAATGELEALVEVAHPIVRAHPRTGRPALYFDLDRATHVAELPLAEGRALLQALQDHAEQCAPRYEHAWRDHDVLIWDNAAVQHKASSDFPVGEPRRFWRYMVEGSLPRTYSGPISHPPHSGG
jgi:alpha-ketoglutarate-dependent taurine dioxygenase